MRHTIKLGFLALGLSFLFWWGWAGNFLFTPGSLFRLTTLRDYYVFTVGGTDMGYTRREVEAGGPDQGFSITEDSLVRLALPGLVGALTRGGAASPGTALHQDGAEAQGGVASQDGAAPQGVPPELRLRSEATYGPDGRLRSALFTVPGLEGASAEAKVSEGSLDFTASLGSLSRKVSLKLPSDGPVLVSGVVPWLSRQREVPLGKVLYVRVFDPVNMDFETARLTVEDDTEASEEVQVFKVTLTMDAGSTTEWLDANGRLLRQRMDRFQAGLDLIGEGDSARAEAEGRLDSPPEIPAGGAAMTELAARYFLNMTRDVFDGGK
ncbi:MAG: hypothetical protein LBR80_07975 [Deltaproteobacteria bacterium]|nr:hypothetical protein [Deltaproteobacteria bacterium]